MTHDELLARIAKLSITPETNVVPSELATALMSVVGLHKPFDFSLGGIPYTACECGEEYPCPTIEAIEKSIA
jgi:hypothetical protein